MPNPNNNTNHKHLRRIEHTATARMLNFACFRNRPFFHSALFCQWFIEALEAARAKHEFQLWAFVIMPDHVHLLIFPRATVPPILTSIKQSLANRAINWTRDNAPHQLADMEHRTPTTTTHRFWQRGGGYDRNLWTPRHIWNAIDYIHHNPVKANLCAKPEDWPWSSATRPPLIQLNPTSLPPVP